jgi:hypothetical protein
VGTVVERAARGVDRQQAVVDAEAIALGVTVGEQPTCSMRSGEKPMPGTTLAGVKAACSTWAK